MKGSNIFFGATVVALAAVGAISSASTHRVNPVYYQSSPNVCTRLDLDFSCQPGLIQSCPYVIGGTVVQLKQSTNPLGTLCFGNLYDGE